VTASGELTLHEFFERARDGELTALRCGKCGELTMPPRALCPSCQHRAWKPVALRGEGVVESFTVIRVAPKAHAGEAPYAVAVVRLAEGVAVLGRLLDVPLDRVAVGLRVRYRPILRGDQTAIGFGPA
jgi:hypothetical protein